MSELLQFFEFLYGEQSGFAYSPTKHPSTGDWKEHYFKWPEEKDRLIEHVQNWTDTHEVYSSPSLFETPAATKDAFKGTHFIWAEFDGNAPASLPSGFPEPAIKLRSSDPGNQHWYWRLDHFSSDANLIENLSQRIAYHLDADLACWNANRVLRPPGTVHHDSAQKTKLLRADETLTWPAGAFAHLPDLPIRYLKDSDIGSIPAPIEVINRYTMKQEDLEFFMTPSIKSGKETESGKGRSAALAKLGHICMELGMSNAESLSLLLNADSRWGKFAKRKDRKERLLGIINYCRARHPIAPVEEDAASPLRVYTYEEFMNTQLNAEWVVEGLIHRAGFAILSGPPGVGKSQLSVRLAEKLVTGQKFLKWSVPRPMRILFVSMEMPHEELYYMLTDIMSIEDHELLRDNFLLMPVGSSIHLNSRIAQQALNKQIEEFQPDGIIFDSLGQAINDEIGSDKVILETFDYVSRTIRGQYGAFVWFIHHPRKEQVGNKKPKGLDDLYGSRFISTTITTGIGLWPDGNNIEVNCLKLRMAEAFKSFKITRTSDVDFALVQPTAFKLPSTGLSVFGDMEL